MPRLIAYVIGQVAYVPEHRRHQDIPSPVVRMSEITWLVDQYEKELRSTSNRLVRMGAVQELCTRVFGVRGEEIFTAGYPELSTESLAANYRPEDDPDNLSSYAKLIGAAARYVPGAKLDPCSPSQVAIPCLLETIRGQLPGHLVLIGGTVGFYDSVDLTSPTRIGTPIILHLDQLTGCHVAKPANLILDWQPKITFNTFSEDYCRVGFQRSRDWTIFRFTTVGLGHMDRYAIETDLRRLLLVIALQLYMNGAD